MNTQYNLWTLTDGSQGMISQVNGLAEFLVPKYIEKKIKLMWPWSILQPGFLPFNKKIFNSNFLEENLPNISISCGRRSVYASIYLKKILKNKISTIHIQNPKVNLKKFDYIISPNHDNLTGSNVINSTGALHYLNNEKINNSKKILDIPSNKSIVTIILGGDNNHYNFNENILLDLLNKLDKLNKKNNKYHFVFITSRRTNENFINIIKTRFKGKYYVWDKKSDNPYLYSLKCADYIIITSDSSSMISEASVTGKPIYIFHLPFKRKSIRFENFHNEFMKIGITRPFSDSLDSWSYKALNESKRIAGILSSKILKHI